MIPDVTLERVLVVANTVAKLPLAAERIRAEMARRDHQNWKLPAVGMVDTAVQPGLEAFSQGVRWCFSTDEAREDLCIWSGPSVSLYIGYLAIWIEAGTDASPRCGGLL